MTRNIALSRPALSAIAAFLVLSTPAAFAQEVPTITMTPPVTAPTASTPQPPPTAAEPSTTAPVATPQATQPATPKPVIRVPLDIAPAETAPVAEAAERAAPAPKRAERAAPRAKAATVAAAPTAATTTAAAPTATTEAPSTDALAPITAPGAAPVEPLAAATPPPAAKSASTGSELPWELLGGAAALLLAAGAGLAFARRRRVDDMIAEDAPVYVHESEAAPTIDEARPWVTPAYAPRENIASRTVPAFAAVPSGSMGRHEAMAMAGPTPDNPFVTLSKRLKRARFLDRKDRLAYEATLAQQKDTTRKPASAWEISQRPAAPIVPEQEVRRPEPARGRPDLRPGFARN